MVQKDLWKLLDGELGAQFENKPPLKHAALKLHSLFTENRAHRIASYFDSSETWKAYLSYYLPMNFFKVLNILRSHRPQLSFSGKVRILDYGCGPATASLASLSFLKTEFRAVKEFEIVLVDHQKKILPPAEELLSKFATQNELDVKIQSSTRVPSAPANFDFILAVNVLNELKQDVSSSLWELLSERGTLLIVEPSHRVTSQRLIRNRERLLKNLDAHILGPCLHHDKCPVYRSKNWCHFSIPHEDERMETISMKWFRDPRAWLKFSYLFFKKSVEARVVKSGFYRAIGDLHPVGGGRSLSKDDRSIFKHGNLMALKGQKLAIDLCQPVEKKMYTVNEHEKRQFGKNLTRGSVVEIQMNQIQKVRNFKN